MASRRRLAGALVAVLAASACADARLASPRDPRFPCSHAFLPMGPTVRREYLVTARDPAIARYRYVQSYGDRGGSRSSGGGFTESMAFSNGVRRVQQLDCEPGGGWRVVATAVEGVSGVASGALAARGTSALPAPEAWRLGETWTESGEIAGDDLPGLPAPLAQRGGATVTGTVTVASTIAAHEAVEVPAGRFEAYRVDATITQRVTVDTGVLGKIPVELVTTTRTWYARDVGMVRQVAEPYGLTTELVSAR